MYLKLHLKASLLEYPKDHLNNMNSLNKLEKKLSKGLTAEDHKIIKILQKNNCDSFGVGRQLIAHHPKLWNTYNYKNVKIHSKVNIEIINTGILH